MTNPQHIHEKVPENSSVAGGYQQAVPPSRHARKAAVDTKVRIHGLKNPCLFKGEATRLGPQRGIVSACEHTEHNIINTAAGTLLRRPARGPLCATRETSFCGNVQDQKGLGFG